MLDRIPQVSRHWYVGAIKGADILLGDTFHGFVHGARVAHLGVSRLGIHNKVAFIGAVEFEFTIIWVRAPDDPGHLLRFTGAVVHANELTTSRKLLGCDRITKIRDRLILHLGVDRDVILHLGVDRDDRNLRLGTPGIYVSDDVGPMGGDMVPSLNHMTHLVIDVLYFAAPNRIDTVPPP